MVAAGLAFLFRYIGNIRFSLPLEIGEMRKKEGKEEILRLRGIGEHMRQQDSFFFSYIPKMLEFSLFLEIGEMRRKEGKEEDRQQGSLLASIGNIRGGAYFRGEG